MVSNFLEELEKAQDIDDLEILLEKIKIPNIDDISVVKEDESIYTIEKEKYTIDDLRNLDLSKFEKQGNLKSVEIEILEEIKERLINGKGAYKKSWFNIELDNKNYLSKNKYSGINEIYLSMIKDKYTYSSNYWLTFSQMKKLNEETKEVDKKITLRKGSKGHKIIYPLLYDKVKERGYSFNDFQKLSLEERQELLESGDIIITKKEFTVFNASCFKNIDLSFEKEEILANLNKNKGFIESLKDKDNLIKFASFMGVGLEFVAQNRAFYNIVEDRIYLPIEEQFLNTNNLKSVFFHELAHATGHEKRLNRKIRNSKRTKKYAFEEIVAETSTFILANKFDFNTDDIKDNNAEYINSWARRLINNPEKVIQAIRNGIEAKNYILKEKENFELLNDIDKSLIGKDFLDVFKDKEFVFKKSFEEEVKEKGIIIKENSMDTVSLDNINNNLQNNQNTQNDKNNIQQAKKKEQTKTRVKKKSKGLSF